jgi:prepilin-type N-terminal cleavage/methylation domain-containing protein
MLRSSRQSRLIRVRSGFSLLELMVVLGLIVVIASIAAPALMDRMRDNTLYGAADQVRQVWRLAFGREPLPDELNEAAVVVNEHDLATLCRVIFNSNEFLFLP